MSSTSLKIHSDSEILSKTISWLRFPLIVLVVFIHVNYGLPEPQEISDFPVANAVLFSFLEDGIARVAVPLFFFISGFLYFYKTTWSTSTYRKKVYSRIKTLAVPFLVWSIPAVVYMWLVFKLGLTKSMVCAENHSLWDWLKDVYGTSYGETSKVAFPIIVPFWFIRDLFVVGLLSPLWFLLLKNRWVAYAFLVFIGGFWLGWNGLQIPGLSTTSVFFFCVGAFFSIHGCDFSKVFSKIGIGAGILWGILLVANALTYSGFSLEHQIIHRLMICVGIVASIAFTRRGIEGKWLKESVFLSSATFLVYVGHSVNFFCSPVEKLIAYFYVPESSLGLIILFFAKATFQIVFWLGVYWCLRKWMPWSLRLLSGGR